MFRFIHLIHKSLLAILFAAALNLSFHVSLPEPYIGTLRSGTEIQEQSYFFIPFGEKEASQPTQPICKVQTLSFTSFTTQWTPLQKSRVTLELFYRLGLNVFKEYPFIVLVRTLRI